MTTQSRRQPDLFLVGIITAVVLLILLAIFLVWQTPSTAEYQAEDSPEGIAHNYLLALQREEYERAYGYLSPNLPGYPPSAEAFFTDVHRWCFRDSERTAPLAVVDSDMVGQRAVVTISETIYHRRDGLLDFGRDYYQRLIDVSLEQIDGRWYIQHSDRCWSYDWDDPEI